MASITIADYGIGNLLSVRRAFEHLGLHAIVESDPNRVAGADYLVLPGVGAFGGCADRLRETGMRDAVLRFASRERPLLGICVGMQLLLNESEEFGHHEGLGLISGSVCALPAFDSNGRPHKIPHIGWSPLQPASTDGGRDWAKGILAETRPGAAVYFVHSFGAQPDDPSHRLAETFYGGHRITAVIAKDNICGTQFHPEKSGQVGLAMLRRFAEL